MGNNTKIESKFNVLVYVLYIMIIIAAVMLCRILFNEYTDGEFGGSLNSWIMSGIALVMLLFVSLHPLAVCFHITVTDSEIIYRWKFLPFRKKVYRLDALEGYYTMKVRSRESEYLTYILVTAGGNIVPPISSFYFDNAKELTAATGTEKKGAIPFSWKRYFVDITVLKKIS